MNLTLKNATQLPQNPILLEPQIIWYWSVRIVIAVFTVTGNGLVICLITTRKHLQVACNWFVLSLAVSDFCVGLLVTPTGLACSYWMHCDWRPQLVFYNFLLFTSTLNLWAIAYDRFSAIVHPLRYIMRMTKKRIITIIASSWSISLLASILRLAFFYDGNLRASGLAKYYRVLIDLWFGILSSILFMAVYVRILVIVGKHRRQISSQRAQLFFNAIPHKVHENEREKLSAKILGILIAAFVACYVLSIYISFCSNFKLCTVSPKLSLISLLLVHLNCAVNFIVYALLKKDFRRELRRLFKCDKDNFLQSQNRVLRLSIINRASKQDKTTNKV